MCFHLKSFCRLLINSIFLFLERPRTIDSTDDVFSFFLGILTFFGSSFNPSLYFSTLPLSPLLSLSLSLSLSLPLSLPYSPLSLSLSPPLQVLIISLLTGIISYPNPYTRANASEIIRQLFSQCGPEDNNDLW